MPHHTIEESLYFYTRYHLFSMVNFPKSQYFLSPDKNTYVKGWSPSQFKIRISSKSYDTFLYLHCTKNDAENIQFPWKLLTVTKEMLGLRLHFPCSKSFNTLYHVLYKQGKKKKKLAIEKSDE